MNTMTQPKIESIKIIIKGDESPDTSYLGEYTDEIADWAIERSSGEYVAELPDDFEIPPRGREYRFFVPYAGGEEAGTKEYKEYGKQDYARSEAMNRGDWCHVGIYAEAEVSREIGQGCRRLQSFRSSGLWGIESDSDESYIDETAREELANLKDHLESFGVDTANFDELSAEALDNLTWL
jgi:hypothetical protein